MNKQKLAKISKLLRKRGFRITGQRKAILSLILENEGLASVDELRKMLKQKDIAADRATVYRNLQFLKEMGFINSVKVDDNVQRFEQAGRGHHHHFICDSCNRIEHFEIEDFEKELTKQGNLLGKKFKMNFSAHTLNFYGKCDNCG